MILLTSNTRLKSGDFTGVLPLLTGISLNGRATHQAAAL